MIASNNPSQLSFIQSQVKISENHLILDTKLKFNEHLENKINKCNRIIGAIKKLSLKLSRTCLLTIYIAFVKNCEIEKKIVKNLVPKYLQSYLLPQALNQYSTRSAKKNLLTALPSKTLSFSNTFCPYYINEWNELNDNLKNTNSIYKFKNWLTKFITFFCI